MQLIKATLLAEKLRISRRTVAGWCAADPKLAIRKGRSYYIKVEQLARRPGLDLVSVLTLGNSDWVRAVHLAKVSRISRKTICNWIQKKPRFAKRIGRIWYIDLAEWELGDEARALLRKRLEEQPGP